MEMGSTLWECRISPKTWAVAKCSSKNGHLGSSRHAWVKIIDQDRAMGLLYLAFGPRYFFVHLHHQSSYVDQNLGKSGIGCFLGSGFTFLPYKRVVVDLFGDYSYEKAHFIFREPTNIQGAYKLAVLHSVPG